MDQYLRTIFNVLSTGTRKENRTGVDTISTFNHNYEIDLREGFPLLTTKAMSWKNIVIEMLWFLSGQTDISILKRHGCKFWDAWADENGQVPSAYGNFWRHFPVHSAVSHPFAASQPGQPNGLAQRIGEFNDQIAWVLAEMKRNPMSRRMVVSAWAPGNAQTSKLPPCHSLFIFNVQNMLSKSDKALVNPEGTSETPELASNTTVTSLVNQYEHDVGTQGDVHDHVAKTLSEPLVGDEVIVDPPEYSQRLCLHLTQRSCDVALGVPYNIASYALLLELFSRFTGIKPGIFAHTLVDAHIYTSKPDGSMAEYDHVPGLTQQLNREPRGLPRLVIGEAIKDLNDIEALMDPGVSTEEVMKHFVLEGYSPHPAIPFKVAV